MGNEARAIRKPDNIGARELAHEAINNITLEFRSTKMALFSLLVEGKWRFANGLSSGVTRY
jgi:hypothetical protein